MRVLVNLNPAAEFRAMEDVFERLLGTPSRPVSPAQGTLPVDITEFEGKLFIHAAVPGVEPSELDIQIEKNVLTIRGETQHESEQKEAKIYRREVSYGAFARSIRLPEGLDLQNVDAEFKNGIVTITLPRLPEEKPQSVRVNVKGVDSAPQSIPTQTAE